MTLARTALRLAAVGTLTGVQGSRPTMAENRVFDSRISFIDPKVITDAKPILIVQTDADEGDPTDLDNGVSPRGGPPFWRNIDLVIECAMVARATDGADEGIGYPVTDAQLEAQLDFLEYQVWSALAYDASPVGQAFRKISKLMHYESHRQASDEFGDRAAIRVLTFRCRVHDWCPAFKPGTTGLDRLPKPLSDVAKALPQGSAGSKFVAVLADAMTAPDPGPMFHGISAGFYDLTVDTPPNAG